MTRGQVSDDKKEEVIAMNQAGMRTQEIASEVDLAPSTVYKIIADAGLNPVKQYALTSFRNLTSEEEDDLVERYYAMEPVVKILDDFGLTHTQLYLFLQDRGLEPRTRQKVLRDARELAVDHAIQLYVETNMTVAEIVYETGVHQPIINAELRRRGIPSRRPRRGYDDASESAVG